MEDSLVIIPTVCQDKQNLKMLSSPKQVLCLLITMIISCSQSFDYKWIYTIQIPAWFDRVTYSQSSPYALFYGYTSNNLHAYNLEDWTQKIHDFFKDYPFWIGYAKLFYDDQKKLESLIYAGGNGEVRVRRRGPFTDTNAVYEDYSVMKVADNAHQVKNIVLSPENNMFALFCEGGSKVYISQIQNNAPIQTLDYSDTGIVKSLVWMPNSSILMINVVNLSTKFSSLISYNIQNKSKHSTSQLFVIDDMDSLKSQSTYYLFTVQRLQNNNLNIRLYQKDLVTYKVFDSFALTSSDEISISIKANKNFLSVKAGDKELIWNIHQSSNIASYTSVNRDSGLSLDGSYLVTLSYTNESTLMYVYKICGDMTTVYDPDTNNCLQCQQPCQKCFMNATKCQSCISGYYSYKKTSEINYRCKACVRGCLFCQADKSCFTCDHINNWQHSNDGCVCMQDYEYSDKTQKCEEKSGNVALIVGLVIGAIVIIGIVWRFWRWRSKKIIKIQQQNKKLKEPLIEGNNGSMIISNIVRG